MKISERLRQIGRIHPLARLLYANAIARAKGILARFKYHKFRREPTLENIEANTKYFARIYGLKQALYFETITSYAQDVSFRKQVGADNEYPPLCHLAAYDFMKENVHQDAKILDICCGMGHSFIFLKKLGFHNFTGIDNSLFQPRILTAARKFLSYYRVSCRFHDFDAGNGCYYDTLKEKFDVITYFSVGTHYLFRPVFHLLNPGGYFIYETVEKSWGGQEKFEFEKIYEGFGQNGQNVMVLRVRK